MPAIEFDRRTGGYRIRGSEVSGTISEVVSEYCHAALSYRFEAGGSVRFANGYDDVLCAAVEDPDGFSIPAEFSEDYSGQELELVGVLVAALRRDDRRA